MQGAFFAESDFSDPKIRVLDLSFIKLSVRPQNVDFDKLALVWTLL